MDEPIISSISNRVMVISIQRPEKKNAITQSMYAKIAQAIEEAQSNSEVRVLVIRGTQECFTSGNDLADFLALTEVEGQGQAVKRMMLALRDAYKPVIAAVTGFAVGIGTTLLLHCDLVYATRTARFQLSFAQLGLCPEFAASYLLPRLMGHVKASELLLCGEVFNADKACDAGIINAVMDEEGFFDAVQQRAIKLAQMPPAALRTTKSLLKRATQQAVQNAMEHELEQFFRMLQAPEAREALQAFMEKRKPDFSTFE